jgi:hypothetical protein
VRAEPGGGGDLGCAHVGFRQASLVSVCGGRRPHAENNELVQAGLGEVFDKGLKWISTDKRPREAKTLG